jgi:hypothetical protein
MTGDDHIDDQAGLYVLGALTPDEMAPVERHLAVCFRCRQVVEETRQTIDLLAFAVPAVTPPRHLRQRILSQLRTPAGVAAQPAARRRLARRSSWRWVSGAVAAALSVLVALIGMLAVPRPALEYAEELPRLPVGPAQSRTATPLLSVMTATHEPELMVMLPAPRMITVPLQSRYTWSAAGGSLDIHGQNGECWLRVHGLPPLPEGWRYQIWLIHEAGPLSVGMLPVDPHGSAALPIALPGGTPAIRGLRITLETTGDATIPSADVVLDAAF